LATPSPQPEGLVILPKTIFVFQNKASKLPSNIIVDLKFMEETSKQRCIRKDSKSQSNIIVAVKKPTDALCHIIEAAQLIS